MDPEDTTGTPATVATPATAPIIPAAAAPQGKTFSEDYVSALREEAKANRLGKKATESWIRDILGLTAEEEISQTKVEAYKANQTTAVAQAIAKANNILITAEIRSLPGYNTKLVEGLLTDRSKITVDDNGKVTGLTEAIAALEAEYPEIKKAGGAPAANPANNAPALTDIQELETMLAEAQKSGKTAQVVAIRNQIITLQRAAGK